MLYTSNIFNPLHNQAIINPMHLLHVISINSNEGISLPVPRLANHTMYNVICTSTHGTKGLHKQTNSYNVGFKLCKPHAYIHYVWMKRRGFTLVWYNFSCRPISNLVKQYWKRYASAGLFVMIGLILTGPGNVKTYRLKSIQLLICMPR